MTRKLLAERSGGRKPVRSSYMNHSTRNLMTSYRLKQDMEDIALDQKKGLIDRYFEVSRNHSTIRTEVLAGITTFITIAYILILNPQVLSDPYMIMGDTIMAGKIANGVFLSLIHI